MYGVTECDSVLCRMLIPTTELGRFDSMVMPFELEAYDILKSRSSKQKSKPHHLSFRVISSLQLICATKRIKNNVQSQKTLVSLFPPVRSPALRSPRSGTPRRHLITPVPGTVGDLHHFLSSFFKNLFFFSSLFLFRSNWNTYKHRSLPVLDHLLTNANSAPNKLQNIDNTHLCFHCLWFPVAELKQKLVLPLWATERTDRQHLLTWHLKTKMLQVFAPFKRYN